MTVLETRASLTVTVAVAETLLCVHKRRASDGKDSRRGDNGLEHLILLGCQGDANKITMPRWLKLNFGHLKQKAHYGFVILNRPSSRLHNVAIFVAAGGASGFF
jgi:hypothetical protein